MSRQIIALLFMVIGSHLVAQSLNQRKLLAAHHIRESRTYRYSFKNNDAAKDTVLAFFTQYNVKGYPVLEMYYENHRPISYKQVHEYLYDSLRIKTFLYSRDGEQISESTMVYDARGNHIQNINHFFKPRKGLPDTSYFFMVYDSLNHLIETSFDEGPGKTYRSRYVNDARGNAIIRYPYTPPGEAQSIKGMEYDSNNNMIAYYELSAGKKELLGRNLFNAKNQWAEQRSYDWRKVKKHFFSLSWSAKKRIEMLVKYEYDSRGLLISEHWYKDSKLWEKYEYKYN